MAPIVRARCQTSATRLVNTAKPRVFPLGPLLVGILVLGFVLYFGWALFTWILSRLMGHEAARRFIRERLYEPVYDTIYHPFEFFMGLFKCRTAPQTRLEDPPPPGAMNSSTATLPLYEELPPPPPYEQPYVPPSALLLPGLHSGGQAMSTIRTILGASGQHVFSVLGWFASSSTRPRNSVPPHTGGSSSIALPPQLVTNIPMSEVASPLQRDSSVARLSSTQASDQPTIDNSASIAVVARPAEVHLRDMRSRQSLFLPSEGSHEDWLRSVPSPVVSL